MNGKSARVQTAAELCVLSHSMESSATSPEKRGKVGREEGDN